MLDSTLGRLATGDQGMSTAAEKACEFLGSRVGSEEGAGDWFEITQERVNDFADATLDHQFIHVDPEAAKQTPFGGTIAHGFLTLSLLVHLSASIPREREEFAGAVMGINYGFDRVRFISPVPVGARIRARSELAGADLKDANTVQTTRTITVEIEGSERPACVADWLTRTVFG